MRITAIRETTASLTSTMRNAFIDFSKMTLSVVAVETDVVRDGRRVVGFGFNSNGRYAQGGVLRERLIPRILEAKPGSLLDNDGSNLDPEKIRSCLLANEKPGGHGERAFAIGAIDSAIWDLVAKIEEKPLYRIIADRFNAGTFDAQVPVYPGGGYYDPDKSLDGLRAEMQTYRQSGYTLMKMKIGGASLGEDMARIETALEVAETGSNLAVDANAALSLDSAIRYASEIDGYNLAWFEEPVQAYDLAGSARVAAELDTPIASGETEYTRYGFQDMIERRAADIFMPDLERVGGVSEWIKVAHMAAAVDIPVSPHIFTEHSLQLCGAVSNVNYAEHMPWFVELFKEKIEMIDGDILIPDRPGMGFSFDPEAVKRFSI